MIAVASAGCSSLLGIDDLRLADARGGPDTGDAPGANCIGGGLLTLCPDPPPTSQLVVVAPRQIDTGSDPACLTMMSGTTEVCVMLHASIQIGGTLRAVGPRPLVLASWSSISLPGTIDLASHLGKPPGAGAEPRSCPPVPAPPPGTGAGGAGGSFGGAGGRGGNKAGPSGSPVALAEIRGGCAGSLGDGATPQDLAGSGGGAVYLIARDQIVVDGAINASGAGGGTCENGGGFGFCGGAGGGAGGLIGLDAPTITGAGTLFANGGGGSGANSQIILGSSGGESPDAKSPGIGGNGSGKGGDGSVGTQLAGQPGSDGQGGGGGGGGAGAIYVRGAFTVSGAISPPQMPAPR
jgi:hypothetical protein